MNKKFLKIWAVILFTFFMIMAMGYAGTAMWSEAKALSVVCYLVGGLFAYLGIRTVVKLNNE